jgi:predicted ChrR family anti-sigma factor
MNNDHPLGSPAELAALYLAGSLTLDEQERFEAHVASGCAACRAELAAFEGVAAALAAAVEPVTPDPKVRAALLARLEREREPSASTSPSPEAKRGETEGEILVQRASEGVWRKCPVPGVSMRVLFVDRESGRFTALVRMEAGASFPSHAHAGPEESVVLEGDLRGADGVLGPGDYWRAPAGSRHGVQTSEQGCLLLTTASLADFSV